VRGQLSRADLAVCHVETPLSADDTHISGYPVFNTPHELVDAIRATGWESCSTASNHSIDHGETGVRATLDWLDKVGVAHAGTARSAQEAQRVEMHTVNGVRVGLLAYTYGTNGVPVPAAKPWLVNVVNVPKILADAHAARKAGAQFVAVSMHWGQENQTAPTALQRSQAAALLASPDVDLIIGDHVHVVQPIERIGSKYVIYGLGNFLSNQTAACCPAKSQDGIIATATLTAAAGGRWNTTIRYTHPHLGRGRPLRRPSGGGGPQRSRDPSGAALCASGVVEPNRRGRHVAARPRPRRNAGPHAPLTAERAAAIVATVSYRCAASCDRRRGGSSCVRRLQRARRWTESR